MGQLGDLVFDGQTAITQRGLRGTRLQLRGQLALHADPPENDPPSLAPYAGPKREFLALVPWVTRGRPRAALRAMQAKLAPGSGDPLENDYVETAIAADLPFPPRPPAAQLHRADDDSNRGWGEFCSVYERKAGPPPVHLALTEAHPAGVVPHADQPRGHAAHHCVGRHVGVTTALVPITALSPTVTPRRMQAPYPIQTLLPTRTSRL